MDDVRIEVAVEALLQAFELDAKPTVELRPGSGAYHLSVDVSHDGSYAWVTYIDPAGQVKQIHGPLGVGTTHDLVLPNGDHHICQCKIGKDHPPFRGVDPPS